MTHQTPETPIQPIDQASPANPDTLSNMGMGSNENSPLNDQLIEGVNLLAHNIQVAAKSGEPEATKNYLTNLLKNEEGTVNPYERRAAFELLAEQQEADITDGLLLFGEHSLQTMNENNNTYRDQAETGRDEVHQSFRGAVDTHEAEVGSNTEHYFNSRGATYGQENVMARIRYSNQLMDQFSNSLHQWGLFQVSVAEANTAKVHEGRSHIVALDEARKVLGSDKDTDRLDLSPLITEEVLSRFASSIKNKPEDKEKTLEERLAEAVKHQEDPDMRFVSQMRDFIENSGERAYHTSSTTQMNVQNIEDTLHGFDLMGRSYEYDIQGQEEATDRFIRQKNTLGIAEETIAEMLAYPIKTMESSSQEISEMRQRAALIATKRAA